VTSSHKNKNLNYGVNQMRKGASNTSTEGELLTCQSSDCEYFVCDYVEIGYKQQGLTSL